MTIVFTSSGSTRSIASWGLILLRVTWDVALTVTFASRSPVAVCKILVIVAEFQSHARWVDLAVKTECEDGKERLCKHVEDTVVHGLGVRSDDLAYSQHWDVAALFGQELTYVSTFTHTPADRVADPDNKQPDDWQNVRLVNVASEVTSVLATLPDHDPEDIEHGSATEGEEAPLVAGVRHSSNKTHNYHYLIHEHGEENRRSRHASCKKDLKENQGCGDKPVAVC